MSAVRMLRDYMQHYTGREEGQGMVEYSLIIGTISLVIVLAFLTGGVQAAIQGVSQDVTNSLNGATPAP